MTTVNTEAKQPANAGALQCLHWPPGSGDTDAVPLGDLLVALQLLATDSARSASSENTSWDANTPASMQVIKSGALSITQYWSKRTAAAGGATAFLSAAAAAAISVVEPFRHALGDAVTAALIATTGFLLAATGLSIALIVRADLDARGRATAARHAGRAEVAAAFLRAAPVPLPRTSPEALPEPQQSVQPLLLALAAFPNRLKVMSADTDGWQQVTGARLDGTGGVQLKVPDGPWLAASGVTRFSTAV